MNEPFAWFGNATWAMAVTRAGYSRPVMRVRTMSSPMAGRSWVLMAVVMSIASLRFRSGEVEGGHDDVDELDADERRDDPAQPVDEQVAPQQLTGRRGPERHAPEGQRDERDDDQGVEDDRREDGALGRTRDP